MGKSNGFVWIVLVGIGLIVGALAADRFGQGRGLSEQQASDVERLIALADIDEQQAPRSTPGGNMSAAERDSMGAFIRSYLIDNPTVVRDAFIALERQNAEQQSLRQREVISQNQGKIYNPAVDYVTGNPEGDVTLVEYFDYNCPYCRQALPDLMRLLEEDPNLRVVLKEFPVLSEGSVQAAKLAMAAVEQGKYMEYHKALYEVRGQVDGVRALRVAEQIGLNVDQLKTQAGSELFSRTLSETLQLATLFGINGTPSYIIGDRLVVGAVGYEELRDTIAAVRAERRTPSN